MRCVYGDVFASAADVLVIPVNCMGVAGCGLALQCKQKYPHWFETYREVCQAGFLVIGSPVFHVFPGRSFVSFPTKNDWRQPAFSDDVEAGLQSLWSIDGPWYQPGRMIAFPKLGCGAGGLSWEEDIHPLMGYYLNALPCDAIVYL